jgi:hypothetical protein
MKKDVKTLADILIKTGYPERKDKKGKPQGK